MNMALGKESRAHLLQGEAWFKEQFATYKSETLWKPMVHQAMKMAAPRPPANQFQKQQQ